MSSVKHIVNDTFSRNGAIFGAGGITGYGLFSDLGKVPKVENESLKLGISMLTLTLFYTIGASY